LVQITFTSSSKNTNASTHVKNPIAQHATATCCRKCIYKWHGIEKGRALNEVEVDYVVALIMGWIGGQMIFSLS
jgi:hypothetical protein